MIINSITLENIGPFRGKNKFDFTVSEDKNIILIGGKNGSGKTTLLKSIKFGLFGSFCLGLKTETKKYFKEILELLSTDCTEHSITIDFDIVEKMETSRYVLQRIWNKVEEDLEENVIITIDGKVLDDYYTIEFTEVLKSFTSPQLINSYILDGEKVGGIIDKNEVSIFLEETFNSIFNINIINQLSRDLINYLDKKSQQAESEKEIIAFSLMTEINAIKKNLKSKLNELNTLNGKVKDLEIQSRSLSKEFVALGGVNKTEQEKMSEQMNLVSKEREKGSREFRHFAENDLGIALNKNLLNRALNKAKMEIPYIYSEQLKKISEYMGIDFSKYVEILDERNIGNKIIHGISEDDYNQLCIRKNEINKRLKVSKKYLNHRDKKTEEFFALKESLVSQEQIDRFDSLVTELDNIGNSINKLKMEINNKNKEYNDEIENLNRTTKLLEQANEDIRKTSVKDNSYSLAVKAIDINEKFINYLVKSKMQEVSKLTFDIFSNTIRKGGFVRDIKIDKYYDIRMYDYNMREENVNILSSGEKQVLVSSIIMSMFKVSERRETFIFDTPLARLDSDNRYSFINNIIKKISSQVIVLSTDSEFVGDSYEAIYESVAKFYTLKYDELTKTTNIIEGYF